MKPPLAVVEVEPDPALFARVARVSCDRGPLGETLAGCQGLLLKVPGGSIALALRWVPGAVEITAAQGAGEGSMLDYLPWLEAQLAPRAVRLVTQRRGLIRELGKRGYGVRGVILEKENGHGRQVQ